MHILPHEADVRAWLRRHVHRLSAAEIDDLIQDAYTRLWTAEYARISNGRAYFFATVRNLLMEQARRARIVPMERLEGVHWFDAFLRASRNPHVRGQFGYGARKGHWQPATNAALVRAMAEHIVADSVWVFPNKSGPRGH